MRRGGLAALALAGVARLELRALEGDGGRHEEVTRLAARRRQLGEAYEAERRRALDELTRPETCR